MPDTLDEIRARVENEYEAEGEGAWPEECFVDAVALLAHIDALTAAARPVVAAYLANDDKGLLGACADLSAILNGEPE